MNKSTFHPEPVEPTLQREVAEMAARSAPGGAFYVAGWLVVAYYGELFQRHPMLAWLGLALFLVLAVARVGLARFVGSGPFSSRQLLMASWSLLLLTAALWCGIYTWAMIDPQLQQARMAVILASVAYATVMAHAFAMRWPCALAGIALLYLPGVVISWTLPEFGGGAYALSVYLVYLLAALRASSQQYLQQQELKRELLGQRDLYERQSRTDALTGLDNRREFALTLERAFVDNAQLCLLMIDIDHFKRVNDRYGHAGGDAVLIAFASLLRDHFRQSGARLARLGGEEFGVLLSGFSEDEATASAQALCQRLAFARLAPGGERGAVTVSIGAGQLRQPRHRRPDDLLADVDRSLYRAKNGGRNRVCRISA